MKAFALISFMCFIIFSCTLIAQKVAPGLYLSAQDFLDGKIVYSDRHTSIKPHEVFKKNKIGIKYNDSTFTYDKKDVFGYRDNTGTIFRFFKDDAYIILNPNETILIYTVKNYSGGRHKLGVETEPPVLNYYFSVDAFSEPQSLTLANLEKAFAGNKKFTAELELHFKNDSELPEYDNEHKMYKLNRLLEISENAD